MNNSTELITGIFTIVGVLIGSFLTIFLQWFIQFRKNVIHDCKFGYAFINNDPVEVITITIINKGFVPITIKSSGLVSSDKIRLQITQNLFGEMEFSNKKLNTSDYYSSSIEVKKIIKYVKKYKYKISYYIEDTEGKIYKRKLKKWIINTILK